MTDTVDEVKEKIEEAVDEIHSVYKNPSIIGSVIKELWTTFKKPLLLLILIGFGLLLLIPPLTYLYFIRDLSSKEAIISHKSAGVVLTDRNDKPFFTLYEAKTKHTIPLSQIPKSMQDAVIATEDKDFYQHQGFSIEGIGRALLTDVRHEQLVQGGSTITQQVVKNTLLTQQKSFLRKYQELFLALEIERRYSKQDILEMYLNTIYLGEGAFGVEDAAQTYFNKHARELTLGESALLAAILPAPSAYSPLSGSRDSAFSRQKLVLRLMREQGYITEAQEIQAAAQKITFNPQKQDLNLVAPHFALMVKDELIKKYGEQQVANAGYKVRTTLDLEDQKYSERIVKNQVANLARNKVTNGAAVALNPKTGEILVLVGSHDWFDEENGKINMALRPRQPGSSFKPLVYTKGLEDHDITAATKLEDKPVTYPGGYKPKNYDGKFRGEVLARFALANSLNIPSIHVLERVGIPAALDFATELGITTLKSPSDYGLSLVLGAAEVPLIQMTSSFGTFANKGDYVKPTTILEVRDKRDNVLDTYTPSSRHVVDEGAAFIISSILSDNSARSEVFGNALTISRPTAVKTGTTEDYRDALTIGYTPSLAVGVWVGNNDNTPMDSIAGSLGAAPIWRQMMEYMLAGTPVERFERPPEVIQVTICKEDGLRAEAATSSAYTEFFLPGTIPTKSCTGPQPSITETQTPTPTPTEEPKKNEELTPTPTSVFETPTPTDTPTPTPEGLGVPVTITP